MAQATTTVEMDQQGRVIIPKPVRRKLGIDEFSGDKLPVEIEVRVEDLYE